MSNQSKIYLLFIEERAGLIDVQALLENKALKSLINKCEQAGSLEVTAQIYIIGDPLPDGFILLFAPTKLSPFLTGLKETNQLDAVKRILPFSVPEGTAQAAINSCPFPAIVDYEGFFNYNQNENSCSLIIHKDQRERFEGEGTDLIGNAYRIEGQDLVKIIIKCALKGDTLGKD